MIDLVLVAAFVALPLAVFAVSRSLTWTVVAIGFAFAVGGDAVQSLIALGMAWDVRGLQLLSVGLLAAVLAVAWLAARGRSSVRRQLLVIGLPVVVIIGFLFAMRLIAPGNPGALSAVGYLINHPLAEDNAKWLHLTAQLADGRDLSFSGYAGGPLLLLLSMVAALVSALSHALLGGVNEVAVAANTVVFAQFALIAFVPFALAPFAERRLPMLRSERLIALPLVWTGMLVLLVGSAVITSYGHLSLQFVLIAATLWAATFLLGASARLRLLTTLTLAMSASVWLPLNVLGLLLLVGCVVWTVRGRDWIGLGLTVLSGVVAWDAIMSSLLYLLGFSSSGENLSAEELGTAGTGLPDSIAVANSLFTAPGGVEKIAPLVGGLAVASVLFSGWLVMQGRSGRFGTTFAPFIPIAALSGYVVVIQTMDAITTGGAPHYGGHKLTYLTVMAALSATLPLALSGLSSARSTTPLQWLGIGAVLMVLTVDTILPRAISALSPRLWPSIDAQSPQYWSAAEVRPTGDQPLASAPIACLSAPPERAVPTALPLGQESYACTRILVGLAGAEGETGLLTNWLQTDWLSNAENWDKAHEALESTTADLSGRTVILMNGEGRLAGLTTWGQLLQRYRPNGQTGGGAD